MTRPSNESRAILLTPPGRAAIAVVRLTGPAVAGFLAQHFSARAAAGACVHGRLTDADVTIDDPVVVLTEAGAAADVCLHGGPWVVRSVLDLAKRHGFEIVAGPEAAHEAAAFDARSILEAEILTHISLARTEPALYALLAQAQAWPAFCAAAPAKDRIAAVLEDRGLWWLLHPRACHHRRFARHHPRLGRRPGRHRRSGRHARRHSGHPPHR
jgi:hypothetical protein